MKKKSIKALLCTLVVGALAVFGAGCSLTETLKQLTCEHTYDSGIMTKQATCTEDGELSKTCTLCDKVEVEVVPMLAHSYNDGEITKAPTCTQKGVKTYTCTVCNDEKTESVATVSHEKKTVSGKTATCTEDGYTEYTVCADCGKVLVPHSVIPALGHSKVNDKAIPATCLESGKTAGSHCAVCGDVVDVQQEIPATGHTIVTVAGKSPTCTKTGLTNGSKCSVCDTVIVAQEEIPVLDDAHTYVNKVCSGCGLFETGAELKTLADFNAVSDYTGRTLRYTWEIGASDCSVDDLYLALGDEEQGFEISLFVSLMGSGALDDGTVGIIESAQTPDNGIGHNTWNSHEECKAPDGFETATVDGVTMNVTRDDTNIYLDVVFADVVSITFTMEDGTTETISYDVLKGYCDYVDMNGSFVNLL